jgi:hypothetical protein
MGQTATDHCITITTANINKSGHSVLVFLRLVDTGMGRSEMPPPGSIGIHRHPAIANCADRVVRDLVDIYRKTIGDGRLSSGLAAATASSSPAARLGRA